MGSIERKQREKEAIRNSIICAAREIAVQEGWQAVSMRKIADRIEYTPPIVYEYFKNKEDLFKELCLVGHRIIRKELTTLIQQQSDPEKSLIEASLMHWNFAINHPELYQLVFSVERPTINEEVIQEMQIVGNIIKKLKKEDNEDIKDLVLNWSCLINGIVSFAVKTDNLKNIEFREFFRKSITRYIKGIK